MTTTDLIKILKSVEFGASGKPREISVSFKNEFCFEPDITVISTGDGVAGAQLCLGINSDSVEVKS